MDIFRDTIFRPLKGAAPSNFFTRAKDWPRLPNAHPNWDGGPPPKKINRENLKFGLKFSVWASITSMPVGISLRNFFQTTCREAGVITCVQFLPRKICEGQKTSKFRRDFWKLSTLIASISGTCGHIKNLKSSWSTTTPPRLDKKTWWTLVYIWKSYRGAYWHTQVDIFRDTIFRPLKSAAPSIFYTR